MTDGENKNNYVETRGLFAEKISEACVQAGQCEKSIAQTTRINVEFVSAILTGNFDHLPGKIFGRGFVKNICGVLKIESKYFLDLYTLGWPEDQNSDLNPILSNSEKAAHFGRSITGPKKGSLLKRPFSVILLAASLTLVTSLILIYVSRPSEFELNAEANKEPKISIETEVINKNVTPDDPVEDSADENKSAKHVEKELDAEMSNKLLGSKRTTTKTKTKNNFSDKLLEKKPVSMPVKASSKKSVEQNGALVIEDQENILQLIVKEKVRIKKKIDQGKTEVKEYLPKSYSFKVNEIAELFIYDASSVEIKFNGRKLGNLGRKGRKRKLVFVHSSKEKI